MSGNRSTCAPQSRGAFDRLYGPAPTYGGGGGLAQGLGGHMGGGGTTARPGTPQGRGQPAAGIAGQHRQRLPPPRHTHTPLRRGHRGGPHCSTGSQHSDGDGAASFAEEAGGAAIAWGVPCVAHGKKGGDARKKKKENKKQKTTKRMKGTAVDGARPRALFPPHVKYPLHSTRRPPAEARIEPHLMPRGRTDKKRKTLLFVREWQIDRRCHLACGRGSDRVGWGTTTAAAAAHQEPSPRDGQHAQWEHRWRLTGPWALRQF